ncbi:hypothetical protein FRC03_007615 [Tulasnella sp. 419]|nr:hypothetical protein FRC03_007615 [Tulasnella sp. 419]
MISSVTTCSLDMANGLKYLHEHKPHPIIHANLRGAHVLIDSNGIAQLNAFGISFVANEAYPGSRPPIVYWSSLEQLDDKTPQAASDIFSFALTFIELLTLTDPYKEHKIRNPIQLQKRILAGLRPKFPGSKYIAKGLPSSDCSLWLLLQRCWSAAPEDRPDINEVIEVLIESQDKRMD